MGQGKPQIAIEQALTPSEITAANELTRGWFAARSQLPAAASGLGVWPLLAALTAGASGLTREELLEAVGVDAERAEAIAGVLLGAVETAPALRLALGVWAGARITLDPSWIAKLPTEAVGSLTGDAGVDKVALDRWAAEATDGMIEQMPIDLTEQVDLVLASALMVRTTWITEFEDRRQQFRTGPWSKLGACRALWNTIHDEVLRVSDRASVLTVPGRDDIDVLLALGRKGRAPHRVMSDLIDAAADPGWGRSATDMAVGERAPGVAVSEYWGPEPQRRPEIRVQTVRFSVSADLDLAEDAATLGLRLASNEDLAEFDRLAAQPTYVSQAKQSCTATFSATGFEAAAVTTIAMALAGSAPPPQTNRHVRASIDFDRPFAYIARHRPSGLILVGGWVREPEPAT